MRIGTQNSGGVLPKAATILVTCSTTSSRRWRLSMWRQRSGCFSPRQIDVVFSDVRLPGGRSGFDLAQIVSVRWPRVRVLLASGYYEPESQGYTGLTLLKKPYSLADVAQHIGVLLRGGDGLVR